MSQPPYPPPPAPYGQPTPPVKKGLSTGAIVAIVIGAVVVLLCGVCGVVALAKGPGPAATTAIPPNPSPAETSRSAVAMEPTTPAPGTPTPTTLTVPADLVGTNAQLAYEKLTGLGFTKVTFASRDPDDKVVLYPPNWTVVKVEPSAGKKMLSDSSIILTCSKKA